MHRATILGVCLLGAATAHAQSCGTQVSGVVSGTWTAAGSPYCVVADATVSGSLTIQSGVRVRVWPRVTLRVTGSLVAAGTALAPVVFTWGQKGQPWGGLVFERAASGSTLDHCTIEHADQSGIRIIECLPALANCEIRDCSSPVEGGGIHAALQTGTLTLQDCTIAGCSAGSAGGGVWADLGAAQLVIERCVITSNTADPGGTARDSYGGGIYSRGGTVTLRECELTGNACLRNESVGSFSPVTAAGGGGYFTAARRVALIDCLLANNRCTTMTTYAVCLQLSTARGGGICFQSSFAVLRRCIVYGNRIMAAADRGFPTGRYCIPTALGEGGGVAAQFAAGVANPTLVVDNSVLSGNRIDSRGDSYGAGLGAGVLVRGGRLNMTNATVARNEVRLRNFWGPSTEPPTAPGLWLGSADGSAVASSILYENVGYRSARPVVLNRQIVVEGGTPAVRYSDVQGGFAGTGNVDVDPQFRLPAPTAWCGAVEIGPASPVIDSGDPNAEYDDTSFPPSLGTARNDMGANGGPQAAGWANWTRATPTLEVTPPRGSCSNTNVTFLVSGGAGMQSVGTFLEAVGGVPLAAPFWMPGYAQMCAAGRWELPFRLPPVVCTLPSLTFRAYSFDASFALVASNPVDW